MATRFTRSRRGISARLDAGEREVLRSLMGDVEAMLAPDPATAAATDAAEQDPLEMMLGITEEAVRPDDPALARLLPDASREDGDVSAEFRRYTEAGLRARKSHALRVAVATLVAADAAEAAEELAEREADAGPDEGEAGPRGPAAPALAIVGALARRAGAGRGAPGPPRAGTLVLDEAQAIAWMTALNDVRLVVAERMGLRTDEDAARVAAIASRPGAATEEEATTVWLASVYDFLTWLQETLVGAVASGGYR